MKESLDSASWPVIPSNVHADDGAWRGSFGALLGYAQRTHLGGWSLVHERTIFTFNTFFQMVIHWWCFIGISSRRTLLSKLM